MICKYFVRILPKLKTKEICKSPPTFPIYLDHKAKQIFYNTLTTKIELHNEFEKAGSEFLLFKYLNSSNI